MTSEVTMFLKCDEGSGTTLTNSAGPGTKTATVGATAWNNYNATTRPAVSIAGVFSNQDTINETPYQVFGNPQAPAPWNAATVALLRFSGALSAGLFEPGADPSSHSYGKIGESFAFSSGDRSFFTTPFTTDDRVFGVACFTEPTRLVTPESPPTSAKCDFRDVYAVIEYDPSDWSIVSETANDLIAYNPDGPNRGYGNDGGYAHEDLDLIAAGSYELYAGLHTRVPFGERPAAFASPEVLLGVAKETFQDWRTGNKVYSEMYTQAAGPDNLLGVKRLKPSEMRQKRTMPKPKRGLFRD